MFDEESQKVLDDAQKKSDLGQNYEMEEEDDELSAISVAKVKEILKADDKFDKGKKPKNIVHRRLNLVKYSI